MKECEKCKLLVVNRDHLIEDYYGWGCPDCDTFIPYGSEFWLPVDDSFDDYFYNLTMDGVYDE